MLSFPEFPKMSVFVRSCKEVWGYLWVNSVQVAHEGASFFDVQEKFGVESRWRIRRSSCNYREGLTYPENCVWICVLVNDSKLGGLWQLAL